MSWLNYRRKELIESIRALCSKKKMIVVISIDERDLHDLEAQVGSIESAFIEDVFEEVAEK